MQSEEWITRWEQNQTGFHQQTVNPYLKKYWKRLKLEAGTPVFVPLCGKSRDMLWIRKQGHPVIGIELSELAIEQFFDELNRRPIISHVGQFKSYSIPDLTLLQGDFFNLEPEHLLNVSGIYDRAALIALPQPLRARYVQHLQDIVPAESANLLVTLEYPEHEMDGPPFSVGEDEVTSLFTPAKTIKRLEDADVLEENERFKERGLTSLREKVFLLS